MGNFQENKSFILAYYDELESANADTVGSILKKYNDPDIQWYGVYPFNEQQGVESIVETFWRPLYQSWAHVQRRQDIFIAGINEIDGTEWVTSMGHFMGLLDSSWLGIPATRKITFLRYADFNCIKDGKICKTGFFCNIIGVMNQVGCHPLPQQTGASFIYPGPRTHDGLLYEPQDDRETEKTLELVNQMCCDLDELNQSGVDCPSPDFLCTSWHDDMIWYGPAGIGATYTIPRYQEQHQYPFRQGLKDKVFNGHVCRFAEGKYAGFYGWPNLTNTPVGGFLGLPGNEIRADMRVVDIYRREANKLVENWVLIDLLYWLKQQGLDILERVGSQYVNKL